MTMLNSADFEEMATKIADVMREGGTTRELELVAVGYLATVFMKGFLEGRKNDTLSIF